jgi:hypothetical protein
MVLIRQCDFAEIIDGKEYAVADDLMKETIQVVKVLEMAGRSDIF